MNLTPPPPSQNSHAVRWHCIAESERRVAEIKSWFLCRQQLLPHDSGCTFLPPNQQRQGTEGTQWEGNIHIWPTCHAAKSSTWLHPSSAAHSQSTWPRQPLFMTVNTDWWCAAFTNRSWFRRRHRHNVYVRHTRTQQTDNDRHISASPVDSLQQNSATAGIRLSAVSVVFTPTGYKYKYHAL